MKQGEGRGRLSAGESETGAVSRSMPTGRCGVRVHTSPYESIQVWWVKGYSRGWERVGLAQTGCRIPVVGGGDRAVGIWAHDSAGTVVSRAPSALNKDVTNGEGRGVHPSLGGCGPSWSWV